MAKFKFRFESIRKVKETLEKKAQKELALIEKEIEKKVNDFNKLTEDLAEQEKQLQGNKKLSEVKHIEFYKSSVKKELKNIENELMQLQLNKEAKLNELIEKSREHQIFNTLEENHLEEYRNEQNQIEEKLIDEMATQKYLKEKL